MNTISWSSQLIISVFLKIVLKTPSPEMQCLRIEINHFLRHTKKRTLKALITLEHNDNHFYLHAFLHLASLFIYAIYNL